MSTFFIVLCRYIYSIEMVKMTREIQKNLKKGDFILTCSLIPKQFSHYNFPDRSKWDKNYYKPTGNAYLDKKECPSDTWEDDKWDDFYYDDFDTIGRSNHSQHHCGCKTITEEYALWFIENQVDKLYDNSIGELSFETYENKVKELCKEKGINYEGI